MCRTTESDAEYTSPQNQRVDELRMLLQAALESNDMDSAIEAAAELYEETGDDRAREVAESLVALLRERHIEDRKTNPEWQDL